MEDYPDGFLVDASELCADPLFSEIQKPKEESHPISSIDTGGLVSSADEASNLESEGQRNLEQVDAGDSDAINHGNQLFESGGLVPHPAVSVSSSNALDWDNKSSTSNSSSNEPQSSAVVSVHGSFNGVAEPYVNGLVISGVSMILADDEGVLCEVETVENQQAESRAFVCSSSSGASDLPVPCNSTGDDTSSESRLARPEFPLFDRGQGVEPKSEVEVDVSFSSCPLSSSAAGSTGWEGQRNGGRSLLDVFSGDSSRVHSDTISPAIILSTSNESDYLESQERRLFDHTNLFSNDGVQIDSRYRGSKIQRSNEWRRSQRFEVISLHCFWCHLV